MTIPLQQLPYGASEDEWNNWMSQIVLWSAGVDQLTNGLPVTSQGIQNIIYNTESTANVSLLEIVPTLPASGSFDGQLVYQQSDENLYTWSASSSSWKHTSPQFKGEWSATVLYFIGDQVVFDNLVYISVADNEGKEPDTNPAFWVQLSQSIPNLDGIANGTTYGKTLLAYLAQGRPFNFRGTFDPSVVYFQSDEVLWTGNYYLYTNPISGSGNVPTNTTYWTLVGPTTLDQLANGSTYGKVQLARLSNGVPYTYRGPYSPNVTYQQGDEVSYQSNYYLYIDATPTQGATPTNGGFWILVGPTDLSAISGTLTGSQIANQTITGQNIANQTITGSNIANQSITGSQIGSQTITGQNIGSGTISGANIGSLTITGSNIASLTVTGNNIATGTVTGGPGGNIAGQTITGNNIAMATISGSNLQNATVTGAQIAAATIVGSNIETATITAANIANETITASQIASQTITGSQIASQTITASNIASQTITASEIQNLTITAAQIANLTITGTQIANDTIQTGNVAANAISEFGIVVDVPGSNVLYPHTDSGTVNASLETVNYSSDGGWVEITAIVSIITTGCVGGNNITTVSIYRDGSQVGSMNNVLTLTQMSQLNGNFAFVYLTEIEQPAAGAHVYTINASSLLTAGSSGNSEVLWKNAVLKVREFKR